MQQTLNIRNDSDRRALGDRLELQRLACEVSNEFINLPGEQINSHINQALGRLARFLGFNLAAIGKFIGEGGQARVTHIWTAPEIPPIPPVFTQDDFPWVAGRLLRGEIVRVSDVETLPAEAKTDRQTYEAYDARSVYNWPLNAGAGVIGSVGFVSIGRRHAIADEFQEGIQLFVEILANALSKERAAQETQQTLNFERMLSDLSARLLRSGVADVDSEITRGLYYLAEIFEVDRCTLWASPTQGSHFGRAYAYFQGGTTESISSVSFDDFPWLMKQLIAGHVVSIERLADYPANAEKERKYWSEQQIKSGLVIPLIVDGRLAGCCSFLAMREERSWPKAMVQRLRLAGDLFAHVLERKRAWEQLRESSERFRIVADSAPVMIWMSGTDKLCTFFNKPWLAFTGRLLEQELGNGWADRVHPADLEQCVKTYSEAFDARTSFIMQYRLQRYDGEYRWISDRGVPRYDAEGTFAGYIGSCVDITERQEAEEKFRLAVESSPAGILMVNRDGKIVLSNVQAEKMFGYGRNEMIGLTVETLMPERYRTGHASFRENFLNRPSNRLMGEGRELFAQRKDKKEFPVEVGLNPIASDGRLFVLTTIIDITERKSAEQEMDRQRAELAHAARVTTMGALTGSLAHELNQPLTAILSNAQAALRFLTASSPDLSEVNAALEDIAQDSRRAGEVIREMRSLVRKEEPRLQVLDFNQLINEVVKLLHSDAVIKRVIVTLDLDSGLQPVNVDNVQLQQVMLNLLLNAFDASGDVSEGRRRVRIRTRQMDSSTVQVEVSDHGTGISPENLLKLFEPFRSSKREGLGLGLPICRSIVEAHKGKIWAQNNPEYGATFYFTLPAHQVKYYPAAASHRHSHKL